MLHALQVSAGGTPRQTGKSVSTDVTSSPALRKSTVVGHRAKVMFTGVVDEQGEKVGNCCCVLQLFKRWK